MDVARSPETGANPFRVPSRARHSTPARQAFTEELPTELVSGHHGETEIDRNSTGCSPPYALQSMPLCVATAAESACPPSPTGSHECRQRASALPQYAPTGLRMALKVLHMMIRSPVSDQFST